MSEMQDNSDAQLLREYAEHGNEAAFREIVTRHTDLVFSAALRQVNSPDLASDVAQSVFGDLARKAQHLAGKFEEASSLVGWLFRSTRFAALDQLRAERRRADHERQAMEQLLTDSESDAAHWESIRPLLDEAMESLSEEDRDAVLLRYFKNQDYRTVGLALRVSDDTAQKRVARAVERLRAFFARRGVTVGAGGLVVSITANAVQAAPAGLTATISAAAVLTGTAAHTTLIAGTKIIAMTAIKKSLLMVGVAAVVGTGIYEARQISILSSENQMLQQEKSYWNKQIQALQRERDDASNRLASLIESSEKKKNNASEVAKLRGEVTKLRTDVQKNASSGNSMAEMVKSPEMKDFLKTMTASAIEKTHARLFADLKLSPEEITALKDLIIQQQLASADLGVAMMSGNTDKQLVDKTNKEKAAIGEQIKQMLGEANYAKFQDYEKYQLERTTISGSAGFKDQVMSSYSLSSEQEEQLIRAMGEERQNFKYPTDNLDKSAGGMSAQFSQEAIVKQQQGLEQLDQLYITRAKKVLSEDQLASFEKFLSDRQKLAASLMQMNATMFKPKAGGR